MGLERSNNDGVVDAEGSVIPDSVSTLSNHPPPKDKTRTLPSNIIPESHAVSREVSPTAKAKDHMSNLGTKADGANNIGESNIQESSELNRKQSEIHSHQQSLPEGKPFDHLTIERKNSHMSSEAVVNEIGTQWRSKSHTSNYTPGDGPVSIDEYVPDNESEDEEIDDARSALHQWIDDSATDTKSLVSDIADNTIVLESQQRLGNLDATPSKNAKEENLTGNDTIEHETKMPDQENSKLFNANGVGISDNTKQQEAPRSNAAREANTSDGTKVKETPRSIDAGGMKTSGCDEPREVSRASDSANIETSDSIKSQGGHRSIIAGNIETLDDAKAHASSGSVGYSTASSDSGEEEDKLPLLTTNEEDDSTKSEWNDISSGFGEDDLTTGKAPNVNVVKEMCSDSDRDLFKACENLELDSSIRSFSEEEMTPRKRDGIKQEKPFSRRLLRSKPINQSIDSFSDASNAADSSLHESVSSQPQRQLPQSPRSLDKKGYSGRNTK
eukprot:14953100-Ditylum_brightwellii.AAC.1